MFFKQKIIKIILRFFASWNHYSFSHDSFFCKTAYSILSHTRPFPAGHSCSTLFPSLAVVACLLHPFPAGHLCSTSCTPWWWAHLKEHHTTGSFVGTRVVLARSSLVVLPRTSLVVVLPRSSLVVIHFAQAGLGEYCGLARAHEQPDTQRC